MPVARVQMPDGRIARFEVPDGTTPEQAQSLGEQFFSQQSTPEQPVSAAASQMAAEGMGPLDTAAVAVGRGFDKAATGLNELALRVMRRFAPASFANAADQEIKSLQAGEAVKDSAYAGLQKARPIITGLSEQAVPMVASSGMGIVPAALTFAGNEFLKPGEMGDRLTRAGTEGVGSLIGGYVGQKIGSLVAPVAEKSVSAAQKEALKIADTIGYKPRLSEVTGSPYMARLEDFAARTPGGAGVMQDFAQANQQALNRRAAQGIGETADQLSPQVFAGAADRLGRVFEAIKSLPGKTIAISPNVGSVADDVLRVQGKMIGADKDAALTTLAQQAKLLAANNGKIDGEAYQLLRSGLSQASFDANGTNKALYGKLLKALDDSAEQSLKAQGQGALADALRKARPEYANLKVLEKGATAQGGDVSAARVASTLRTQNPAAFREGRMAGNPLYDVATIGERLRPLSAGSPTYERGLVSNPLATAMTAPLAYGAAKLTTGAIPRGYAGLLATNPTAGLLAQPIGQLASPVSQGLGGLLARRLLLPAVPALAE